jgi:hypothetical protein
VLEVRFDGTMGYNDVGELYMSPGPNNVRYVGKPSPEVDQAWAELIGGGIYPASIFR